MKRNTLLKLFLSPTFILALTGCSLINILPSSDSSEDGDNSSSALSSSENGSTSSSNGSISEEIPPIAYDENVVLESTAEYEQFWNPATSLHFNITMSQEAADFINTYQSNHDDSTYHDYYVPCTFTYIINGEEHVMEEVGIRQKGNMSRTQMLVDNNFSLDKLCHFKLNFKETFDDDEYSTIPQLEPFKKVWDDSSARKVRKNRRLFDMEKLDIKWNRNDDETKAKQAYAYKTFRDNGIMAPHDTLAKTTIGVEGKTPITTVYEAIECIDSVFIQRHFDAERADGDLYKCTYTNLGPANFSSSYKVGNQIGVEDNTRNYHPVYDLKTNKKKSKHENLLNLISYMKNTTSTADQYRYNMERLMDLEGFMKYESIAYLAGNFDDMRNNANNYYLYFASKTNVAYVIPYDFDRCFGAGCEGRNDYMTDFSAESTKMQCNGSWPRKP